MSSMKPRRIGLSLLGLASGSVLPLVTLSCAAAPEASELFAKIDRWISNQKLIPRLKFTDPQLIASGIDLRQLDFTDPVSKHLNYQIEWIVNPDEALAISAPEAAEIQQLIDQEIKTKFSHYYLPVLDHDPEVPVYFEIELIRAAGRFDKKRSFSFSFADLARFNGWTITNLSASALRDLIGTKIMDSPAIISELSTIAASYYAKNPNYNPPASKAARRGGRADLFLEPALVDTISTTLQKIAYFSAEANNPNLFIVNKLGPDGRIEADPSTPDLFRLKLEISTSPASLPDNPAVFILEVPFYFLPPTR